MMIAHGGTLQNVEALNDCCHLRTLFAAGFIAPAFAAPQDYVGNWLNGSVLATDVVGEYIPTPLSSVLQGLMGNERSSVSAFFTFL